MTGSEVRALCMSLPGTTEKETWGDGSEPGHPTFRVRDRIYLILAADEHGGSLRTSREDQAGLLSSFPEAARVAPYVGRFGWTELDFAGLPDPVLVELVVAAWARTAPKRAVAAWEAGR